MSATTFRAYLLDRAEKGKTRRWLRRSPADDVCMDFAEDCAQHPEHVPDGDADLYAYLERRIGDLELDNQITGRETVSWVRLDSGGWMYVKNAVFTGSVLEFLWSQYLKARP